jgi:ribosomal-protein-alanine N-acetyltransferase
MLGPLPSSIITDRLVLEPLDPEVIRLLIRGDRAAAQQQAARTFPDEFPTSDDLAGFLPIQLKRMEADPHQRDWMARLMVTTEGEVIGHCGFHGPPDAIGRAEIGYTVFEEFRGRGFAREAAKALTEWAFKQGEERVFASASPDNAASLAVIRHLGFVQVGTQEDEVDGLELVFAIERPSP